MTLTATYYSPAVPGDAGFSTDLAGDNRPRLGSIAGLAMECELGASGISSLHFDDPTGTAGHAGDAIIGLKQLRVTESEAISGRRRIFTGYIGDRRYSRGGADSPSLVTGAARSIDMTVIDINSFLSFRVFTETVTNRPAETDVARVAWLLGYSFLSSTIFDNGLVSSAFPVNMDKADYRGQRPLDVLNDCAQQSGKNFFVYYDDSGSGEFSLFYDYNDSPVYTSTLQVSNVAADISAGGAGPIWPPFVDAVLTRDPSRIVAGAYIPNGSNSVYRTRPATAIKYGWRDAVAPAPTLTTVAAMTARADRYLNENASEDDRITLTVEFPAAHVNDWREGEAAQVKFSHLPGYESYRWVRALRRTVMQTKTTDRKYQCEYECTPMAPAPSGATARYVSGVSGSGIPVLPRPTTPGNLLVALIASETANALNIDPLTPTFFNDPIPGSPPAAPPYSSGLDGWTIVDRAHFDDTTMNIGPPGHIGATIAYRRVNEGEVTATPVAVGPGRAGADETAVWLWELPATVGDPSDSVKIEAVGQSGIATAFGALSGASIGIMVVQQVDYGTSPASSTASAGSSKIRGAAMDNNNANAQGGGWNPPYVLILFSETGALAATVVNAPYNHWGVAGVAVRLAGITRPVPDIPYPANQSA